MFCYVSVIRVCMSGTGYEDSGVEVKNVTIVMMMMMMTMVMIEVARVYHHNMPSMLCGSASLD